MARTIVVGALMFAFGTVAGVGVSSLMTSGEGPQAEATSDFSPVRHSDADDGDDSATAAPPEVEATSIAADADVKRATEEVASTAERAAAASASGPPRGDGVITGRVADKESNAIRGATVRAAVSPGRNAEAARSSLGRLMGERSLENEIQNTVDGWQKKKSRTIETRTDADGNYRFAELSAGPWTISAEADGYAIEARGTAVNLAPGATVNFEAQAVTHVPVTVLLPDGRNAKRVNLEVKESGGNRTWFDLWTAEEPTVTVVPGVYQVRAVLVAAQKGANDYPIEAASQKVRVEAMTKGDAPPVELKLEPRHGIRGRVLLADGMKIEQGCVGLQQIPAGREPDLATLPENDRKEWFHSESNLFEFLDLAPGNYVIGLMSGWSGPVLSHAVVKVESGVVEQDLTLDSVENAGFFDVTLKGPAGEPLACSNFNYTVTNEHGSSSGWVQGIEQAAGRYWVAPEDEIKEWQDDTTGQRVLTLTANSDTFGAKSVEVPRGAREILFQFSEAATLDVVVVGYVGSGHEGSMDVELNRSGVSRHFYTNETNLQADGTAHFGPVEVGDYELQLFTFGSNRWDRKAVATQKLTLAVGANRASIAVPGLYTVVVTIAGGESNGDNEWLSVQSEGRWDNAEIKDGRAELKDLPAGEYTVHGQIGGKQARATFTVPDQLQVTLVPQVSTAMAVNIEDETKYLKTAGFQSGDLIVGFDGVEFTDEQTMMASFSTLMAKKSATAIVFRGKQRLEIAIEPARLLDPTQVGGNWWPTVRE